MGGGYGKSRLWQFVLGSSAVWHARCIYLRQKGCMMFTPALSTASPDSQE